MSSVSFRQNKSRTWPRWRSTSGTAGSPITAANCVVNLHFPIWRPHHFLAFLINFRATDFNDVWRPRANYNQSEQRPTSRNDNWRRTTCCIADLHFLVLTIAQPLDNFELEKNSASVADPDQTRLDEIHYLDSHFHLLEYQLRMGAKSSHFIIIVHTFRPKLFSYGWPIISRTPTQTYPFGTNIQPPPMKMSKIGLKSLKLLLFAYFLPWIASHDSKRSFIPMFSARDDLVNFRWKTDLGKCQNQFTSSYFDQLSEKSQLL